MRSQEEEDGGLNEVKSSDKTENQTRAGGVPLHTQHQVGSLNGFGEDQLIHPEILFFTAVTQYSQRLNIHICHCGAMQMFTKVSRFVSFHEVLNADSPTYIKLHRFI